MMDSCPAHHVLARLVLNELLPNAAIHPLVNDVVAHCGVTHQRRGKFCGLVNNSLEVLYMVIGDDLCGHTALSDPFL